jgi:V/A-type H+-transporting ATPase subunit E
MDSQLKELLETIKRDGVQTAEKQAEQIIAAAEGKAQEITAAAEKKAHGIVEKANAQRDKVEASSREALKQAARDIILSVQSRLAEMFKTVVADSVKDAMTDDVIGQAVVAVIEAWAKEKDASLNVVTSEKNAAKVESYLRAKLAKNLAAGAEIQPSSSVKSGFRLSMKEGTVYYDFTAEAVAETLSAYVGPRLAALLRESVEGA